MGVNARFGRALMGAAVAVSLVTSVTGAAAAVLNVSTTAQLESALAAAQPGDTVVLTLLEFAPPHEEC